MSRTNFLKKLLKKPLFKNEHFPLWVVVLCLVVSFVGIFGRDLWRPDEPRVAAIALEMSRSGNIIVPHLAGKPFIEKPPLYFVIAAGFIHLLGKIGGNIAAIRLTSALWGIGILLMTFFIGKLKNRSVINFISILYIIVVSLFECSIV